MSGWAAAIQGASGIGGNLIAGAHNRQIGAIEGGKQMQIAEANFRQQEEFAKHGIKWKVQDAKEAGIHPLYALGASTHSFSPVSVGSTSVPDTLGSSIAQAGQDVGRAIASTQTSQQRELANIQVATAQANLDGQVIENQIKIKQLNNINSGPAFPSGDNFIPGQGNSPSLINVKPSERDASQIGRPAQQAGWIPDVGYARTDTGLTPVPSKDVKERIEDQLVPELMWAARNYMTPNVTGLVESFGLRPKDSFRGAPPKAQLPRGARDWKWSFMKQEWQPKYK